MVRRMENFTDKLSRSCALCPGAQPRRGMILNASELQITHSSKGHHEIPQAGPHGV